LLFSPLTPYNG